MANRPKAKGTAFETQCVRYLRKRLGDERIERRALHGSKDMGDIYNIFAHGHEGIAECKSYVRFGPADEAKWERQTEIERGNADADFALLIVHKKGVGERRFGLNECHVQARDFAKIAGGRFTCLFGESAYDTWLKLPLERVCSLMLGEEA